MTARDQFGKFSSGASGAPIQITGEIVGAERVVLALRGQIPRVAHQRIRDAVHALGFALERTVKLEKLNGLVLHRRSGRLARSINTRFVDLATSSTAIVGTSVSYGRLWEVTGSRAYTILPKTKRALFWKGAQHPVRAVLHPAQAARPFLKPTLEEMRPTIRATIQRALMNLGGAGGLGTAGSA